jgi:hypothetical protein
MPVIWDNSDARHKEFAYDDPWPAQFSQDFDPHSGSDSFYGDQRYENTSVPYGNHPSWHHPASTRFPAGRHQARSHQTSKFLFLILKKGFIKKTWILNELLIKTRTLIELPGAGRFSFGRDCSIINGRACSDFDGRACRIFNGLYFPTIIFL